jgi:hypothetical protein
MVVGMIMTMSMAMFSRNFTVFTAVTLHHLNIVLIGGILDSFF